eukprot:scaffold121608_cov48-Phaeocystis_antarctica.AAC.2
MGKENTAILNHRHHTSHRWCSAGTGGSRRCTRPVGGLAAPVARHRTRGRLVSGPPARALAVDAEANLSCAGRDIHAHGAAGGRGGGRGSPTPPGSPLRGGRRAFWAERSRLFSSCPGPDHPGIYQVGVECIHLPDQTCHGSNVAPSVLGRWCTWLGETGRGAQWAADLQGPDATPVHVVVEAQVARARDHGALEIGGVVGQVAPRRGVRPAPVLPGIRLHVPVVRLVLGLARARVTSRSRSLIPFPLGELAGCKPRPPIASVSLKAAVEAHCAPWDVAVAAAHEADRAG